MSIDRVIINSSPLIVLFKSQQAELLPQLFPEILVPSAVWDEITNSGNNDVASRKLPNSSWLQRVESKAVAPEIAAWDLGKGESAVLTLALTTPNCAVIIDDRVARRCSQTLGIKTIGTGGLLVIAKRRGLIPSIDSGIQVLCDAGLWLSAPIVNLLKQQAED